MTKQSIKEQIASKLDSIIENTDTIFKYTGKIPEIEMDILMENVRTLYGLYSGLSKAHDDVFDFEIKKQKIASFAISANIEPVVIKETPIVIEENPVVAEAIIIPEVKEEVVEPVIDKKPIAFEQIVEKNIEEEPVPEVVYVKPEIVLQEMKEEVQVPVVENVFESIEQSIEINAMADEIISEIEEKTNVLIQDRPIEEIPMNIAIEESVTTHEVVAELVQELTKAEINTEAISENLIPIENPINEEIAPELIIASNEEIVLPSPAFEAPAKEEIVSSVTEINEPVIEEPKPIELHEEIVEEDKIEKPIKPIEQNLFSDSLFSLDEFSIQPRNTEVKKKKPKSPLDLFATTTSPSIAESFHEEKPTLNDRLATKKVDNSLASKIQQQPITDLKKSIGINEKFLFINELFDGSMQDYNSAIDKLNNGCKNMVEAKTFLGFLRTNYHWNEAKVSVSLFENLVERRFVLPEEPPF